jgi:phosphoglycolate phosphatase
LIKNIVFDFDGTLVDSRIAVNKIYEYFAEKYKIDNMSQKKFKSLKMLPLIERLKVINIPIYKLPALSIQARKIYSNCLKDVRLAEGVERLLEELKEKNLELSILSSNSTRNINLFLKNNKINYFNDIYSAKNIFKKDKTLLKLLKNKRLRNDEILYLGDELQDIMACKRISVKIAAVAWGYDNVELLKSADPDYLCMAPLDIIDHFF